jgi:hypothetical protein
VHCQNYLLLYFESVQEGTCGGAFKLDDYFATFGELLTSGRNADDRILCERDTSERAYGNNGLHNRVSKDRS